MEFAYPHPIKAVIFDVDGVILDTLPLYYEALARLVPPPFPQSLVDRVNGVSDREACKIFVEFFKLDMTPEELFEQRKSLLAELMAHAPLIPGVDRIIKTVHSKGLPMSIATSGLRQVQETKAQSHRDLFDLFDASICGDEVKAAKPSPMIFEAASKKLGDFDPKNVLVFEDAFNGVKAANAAGMPVVFLHRRKDDPSEGLAKVGAAPTVTIDHFDNFNFDMFNWQPEQ